MPDYVIDSSSVLAFAFGEPGAECVAGIAADDDNHLAISSVNMAEVLAKMIDKGIPAEVTAEILAPLTLVEVSFDPGQARASADLRDITRRFGLSLGDRCCLALGLSKRTPVLTCDRTWRTVSNLGVDIIITRPETGARSH